MSFKFTGIVIKGLGLGKKFGFPHTINLELKKKPRGLRHGVYIVKVKIFSASANMRQKAHDRICDRLHSKMRNKIGIGQQNSKAQIFSGVLHYGPRPSFDAPKSFEIHCFGLKKNVIGKYVEVAIIKRLRAVQKFCSPKALKRAIARDIAQAKRVLKNSYPDKI